MKKKNVYLAFMATSIVALSGLTGGRYLPAKAATGDIIPDAANYLRLEADDTGEAWIQADENTGEKQPIIFFNTNSAWQIASIQKIYYQVSSPDLVQPSTGVLQSTNNYSFLARRDRQFLLWGGCYVDWFFYDWNGTSFAASQILNVETYPKTPSSPARTQYQFTIPEMGKTTIITSLFNLAGEEKEGLNESIVYQYKTSSKGYDAYTSFTSAVGSNFEYYLILPLTTTSQVTVDYLALEATDAEGHKITADSNIQVNTDGTYGFHIIKTAGTLETNSAFFFPGSNKYRLIGTEMSGVELSNDADPEKTYNVVLYVGNLVGQTQIDADTLTYSTVIPTDSEKVISYLFNGDNNSILVDIPAEITDCDIYIHYSDEMPGSENAIEPFGMNLIDNNGNYGIQGALPDDNAPTTSIWASLMSWISGKLGISPSSIVSTLKGVAVAVGVVVGLVLIVQLISLLSKGGAIISAITKNKDKK